MSERAIWMKKLPKNVEVSDLIFNFITRKWQSIFLNHISCKTEQASQPLKEDPISIYNAKLNNGFGCSSLISRNNHKLPVKLQNKIYKKD